MKLPVASARQSSSYTLNWFISHSFFICYSSGALMDIEFSRFFLGWAIQGNGYSPYDSCVFKYKYYIYKYILKYTKILYIQINTKNTHTHTRTQSSHFGSTFSFFWASETFTPKRAVGELNIKKEEYEGIRIPFDKCSFYPWCVRDYEKHWRGFERWTRHVSSTRALMVYRTE